MIVIHDYEKLAEHSFNADNVWEPPSGVIRMHTQDVPLFFKKCRKNRYIIISFISDYGIDYQSDHHPNQDLIKVVHYYKWDEIQVERRGYVKLDLGPACKPENCNISDRYAVKVYSHTHATFNEVPDNIVRWYSHNVNVNHDRIRCWPMGIHNGIEKVIYNIKPKQDFERKLLYVNFRNHTTERLRLQLYFKQFSWATVVDESIPIEQYLEDIANHKYVLCPPGVGYDCYRIYESIQLGAVPVVLDNNFAKMLNGLPILYTNNFININENVLNDLYLDVWNQPHNYSKLYTEYWKSLIEQDRLLL